MSTESTRPNGHELRPVARFFAAGIGVAELLLFGGLVVGFLLPVARSFPAVPLELAVTTAVFLVITVLAQLLFVPLFVELYRFPE
jgi:hypothetical protein